ncbi:MAG: hypothetical protein QW115_05360 [Thermoplasmata archaeon]
MMEKKNGILVDHLIYTRLIDERGFERDYRIVAKTWELDKEDERHIRYYGMGTNPPYDVDFTDCRRMFYLPSGKICLGLTKGDHQLNTS